MAARAARGTRTGAMRCGARAVFPREDCGRASRFLTLCRKKRGTRVSAAPQFARGGALHARDEKLLRRDGCANGRRAAIPASGNFFSQKCRESVGKTGIASALARIGTWVIRGASSPLPSGRRPSAQIFLHRGADRARRRGVRRQRPSFALSRSFTACGFAFRPEAFIT